MCVHLRKTKPRRRCSDKQTIMTPTSFHRHTIPLDSFRALADAGHQIEICDIDGDPALRAAQFTLNDSILYALSYVPVLKYWEPVVTFTRDLEMKNAQVLGLFIHSLSTHYGSAKTEIAIRDLDLTGATPLQSSTIERLIEIARPGLCGFHNLGHTCYANTALKFLIGSIGEKRLIAHLEQIGQNASDQSKQECANAFIDLIKAACNSEKPLDRELRDFFSSLQKQENFCANSNHASFTIVGRQHDAQEFLLLLSDCFDLDDLNTNVLQIQSTLVNDEEKREPKIAGAAYCQNVNLTRPEQASFDLQKIVETLTATEADISVRWNDNDSEDTKVKRIYQWITPDVHKVDRFNLHINAMDYSAGLSRFVLNTDLTKGVSIPVIDQKTGVEWLLALEPRDIIIHKGGAVGASDSAGHYYMYSRHEGGSWTRHNDATVEVGQEIRSDEQAKMISFAVIGRERVRPPLQVASDVNFGMPEKFLPRA